MRIEILMGLVVAVFLLPVTNVGYAAAPQDEVVRAENALADALKKADVTSLDALLATDLIFTHANGVVEDKPVFLGRIKSGALKYEVVAPERLTVKSYGDTAVLHGNVRLGGLAEGKPFGVDVVMTHTWVRQGGEWKLAAHHATLLP